MKKTILIISLFLIFGKINAQTPEAKGLEIAKAAEKADLGFKSSLVVLKMTLKNKHGQTSERNMTSKTLELTEDGDKSLFVFNSPKDIKGTATLTFTHKIGADDQWLFLPSIKRVKRISSNNKSGPFVGSEFAYEDLSSTEVEKYTYKFVEEKGSLLIVDQDPVDPKSGYTRRLVTYNKDKGYRIERVEYYDRKNAHLKTLTQKDYKLYKNKFWRASTLNMVNHQSNKETLLQFSDYDFNVDFSEDNFNQQALKRAGK